MSLWNHMGRLLAILEMKPAESQHSIFLEMNEGPQAGWYLSQRLEIYLRSTIIACKTVYLFLVPLALEIALAP